MSVGIGYDSHRFEAGRELILAGVRIEHEYGLAGHSDADVATHAVIDALLGASAGGDLGEVFPDTDEAWAGADSLEMLRVVVGQVRGEIENIDLTVVGEQPRLAPYKAQMAGNLAEITSARVNVKATTNEGMGWIGRGEGLACIAVAQITDP
ncbi:MAG TPA: 2-C-methyl-D-erythritol 2,4-cyclodiphosphate synthase [Solirubrobacterales bacterium]|nr:2-C-methyl-D-erythritol 2,4-cyclodiphosphate synthase [Solirubrobacterales bacterium]